MSLLVVGNIYPLIHAFQDFPIDSFGRGDLAFLPRLAVELLILCILVGLLTLCAFSIGRTIILVADSSGLHWRNGKKHQSILWQDVMGLHAVAERPAKLASFAVIETKPKKWDNCVACQSAVGTLAGGSASQGCRYAIRRYRSREIWDPADHQLGAIFGLMFTWSGARHLLARQLRHKLTEHWR